MTTNIEVPTLGESIAEATVATWLKKEGDFVQADELIAELETDKVNLEIIAPVAGKLSKISAAENATVAPGDSLGEIDETAKGEAAPATKAEEPTQQEVKAPAEAPKQATPVKAGGMPSPSAQRVATEHNIDVSTVQGTGKDSRITKGDVLQSVDTPQTETPTAAPAPVSIPVPQTAGDRSEEIVPMTRMRKAISKHLKNAQNNAAMLTTYNEVDLSAVMTMRKKYQDNFTKKHGVKLGFMSFFSKAVVEALKDWPAINAEIRGDDIVYKNYYDIGIAVSSDKGLLVPVVRDADQLTMAGIEATIKDYGQRAKTGAIKPNELQGASFTITNGGIFGSMMSMPILNYPQAAILGMHAIKERPVVENGEVVIRPMMYIALTYDHRIVDGREAVSFLVKVKDCLEDPSRLVLGC